MLASKSPNISLPPASNPRAKSEISAKVMSASSTPPTQSISEAPIVSESVDRYSNPPRPRKRMVWRGKACIIALPLGDKRGGGPERNGLLKPEDISLRLENWKEQGFDTTGFILSSGSNGGSSISSQGQSRDIYPNRDQEKEDGGGTPYRVNIPDRRQWEAYVNHLKEERLRALGVTSGDEKPLPGIPSALAMSRQNSSQSPSLANSPSPGLGAFPPKAMRQQVDSAPTFYQPVLSNSSQLSLSGSESLQPFKPEVSHFPRYSMALPNGAPSFSAAFQVSQGLSPHPGYDSPSKFSVFSQPSSRLASPSLSGPPLDHNASALSHSPLPPNQPPGLRSVPSNGSSSQLGHQQHQKHPKLLSLDQSRYAFPQIPSEKAQQSRAENGDSHPTAHRSQPEIVTPVPRGHRLNLSESLQKEVDEAEASLEEARKALEIQDEQAIEPSDNCSRELDMSRESGKETEKDTKDTDLDPDGIVSDFETNPSVNGSPRSREGPAHHDGLEHDSSSTSRLNANAPEFRIAPKIQVPTVFAFSGNFTKTLIEDTKSSRYPSGLGRSGLNVAAPVFTPAIVGKPVVPSREFSFSSSGPSFQPDASIFEPTVSNEATESIRVGSGLAGNGQKIFGDINLAGLPQPVKKSRAVSITKPIEEPELGDSGEDGQEDESGRITQAEGRQKRMRRNEDDGDQIPRFASPPPETFKKALDESDHENAETENVQNASKLEDATNQLKEIIDDLSPSEVSSLSGNEDAAGADEIPWTFRTAEDAAKFNAALPVPSSSRQTLDKLVDEVGPSLAGRKNLLRKSFSRSTTSSSFEMDGPQDQPSHHEILQNGDGHVNNSTSRFDPGADSYAYLEPSYNEINAVMKHLNEEDASSGHEPDGPSSPWRGLSPGRTPSANVHDLSAAQQFLRGPHVRSDAPSPSPNRLREPYQYLPKVDSESADTADVNMVASNARFSPSWRPSQESVEHVHNLGSPDRAALSEWDDAYTSSDEAKLRSRLGLVDHEVKSLVASTIQQSLGPIVKALAGIQGSLAVPNGRPTSRRHGENLSFGAENGDADDEDDETDISHSRLRSPLRDRKYDKLKALLSEVAAAQQNLVTVDRLNEVMGALNDIKSTMAEHPKPPAAIEPPPNDFKTVIEECLAKQLRGRSQPITSSHEAATAEKLRLQIAGLESMLKIADARAEDEMKARRATEDALADNQRLLRSALHDAAEQRESAEETERSLASFHDDQQEVLRRNALLEGTQESLRKTISDLSEKNAALEDTLEEYRLSSNQWREEIHGMKVEKSDLTHKLDSLKIEMEEHMKGHHTFRTKFDQLQEDMAATSHDVARDRSSWQGKEEKYEAQLDKMDARLKAEGQTREKLEQEILRLEAQETESIKTLSLLDQSQKMNAQLEDMVSALRTDNYEHQNMIATHKREYHDIKERGRLELERMSALMRENDESGSKTTENVRAELQAVVWRLETQLGNALVEFDTAKSKHLTALEEIETKHKLALQIALEDKQRSEIHFTERLALASEKVIFYEDKIKDLEEKLEIAKNAAQAAAQAVQSRNITSLASSARSPAPPSRGSDASEKLNPQALRESIMVLQEQLQEREGQIEKLEHELSSIDKDAPVTVKNQEVEINWLRELLGVRNDDLQDIITALSQSTYNREAVKDAAIRLRANLQMQQQEKERALAGGQAFPSLANISILASSPRALPLAAAAAWGNWRKGRDSSIGSLSAVANGNTGLSPSRSSSGNQGFLSGLMTPPSTNIRQTPPSNSNRDTPRRTSSSSVTRETRGLATPRQNLFVRKGDHGKSPSNAPVTPALMRRSSYDLDAESATFGDGESDLQAMEGESIRPSSSEEEPFGPRLPLSN